MATTARFKPYDPTQLYLLPPDMREWLAEDDLVYFILDTVNELDLRAITSSYNNSEGGQPAYNPRMMVALLLYAYCMGVPSSRKIEQATYHSVAFRVLTGDQHPDHDTVATFRKRHLKA
jgi:transposase